MLISAGASYDAHIECRVAITRLNKEDAKKYLAYYRKLMSMKRKDNYILNLTVTPIADVVFYTDDVGVNAITDAFFIKAIISEYSLTFIGESRHSSTSYYITRGVSIEELKDFIKSGKPIEMD